MALAAQAVDNEAPRRQVATGAIFPFIDTTATGGAHDGLSSPSNTPPPQHHTHTEVHNNCYNDRGGNHNSEENGRGEGPARPTDRRTRRWFTIAIEIWSRAAMAAQVSVQGCATGAAMPAMPGRVTRPRVVPRAQLLREIRGHQQAPPNASDLRPAHQVRQGIEMRATHGLQFVAFDGPEVSANPLMADVNAQQQQQQAAGPAAAAAAAAGHSMRVRHPSGGHADFGAMMAAITARRTDDQQPATGGGGGGGGSGSLRLAVTSGRQDGRSDLLGDIRVGTGLRRAENTRSHHHAVAAGGARGSLLAAITAGRISSNRPATPGGGGGGNTDRGSGGGGPRRTASVEVEVEAQEDEPVPDYCSLPSLAVSFPAWCLAAPPQRFA